MNDKPPQSYRDMVKSRTGRRAPDGNGTSITRTALHEEVVRRLRDMIFEGELTPGTRIPERALCERFSISRTPLREALMVLAAEGLVELLPHRGATIAELRVEAVDEMFQVMEALEGLAGELACSRITDEEIAEVRALHKQMLTHYRRRERLEYFRLNQYIHEKIVEASGNAVLVNVYTQLNGRIRRARYLANLSSARWDQAVEEHEEILQALTERDGKHLSGILKEHLRHKWETAKAVLTTEA